MGIEPDFELLIDVMRRTFGQSDLEVDRETTSEEVPGWDSLSHLIFMLEIDKAFGVMLQPDRTADLRNVGELFDMLSEKLSREVRDPSE